MKGKIQNIIRRTIILEGSITRGEIYELYRDNRKIADYTIDNLVFTNYINYSQIYGGYVFGSNYYMWIKQQILKRTQREYNDIPLNTRISILKRDNHSCVECSSQIDLNIHHKIHYKRGGTNSDDNLITLCNNCHIKQHQVELKEVQMKIEI